jgi:L-asparaginase II
MTAGPFVPFAVTHRGGIPESHHFGVAALADSGGRLHGRWGDADFATFPRSALKPFQAVDLVESGALDAYGLSEEHLALACASHYGEPAHAERVVDWLGKIGCGEEDLTCGPALPAKPELARAHLRAGRSPSTVLHNCSGKHTGFLTHARHCGCTIEDYARPDHPLQQRYRAVLTRFLNQPADGLAWSRDDCTLPAPALSMTDMATAAARFMDEARSAPGSAPDRILTAMRHNPLLVAGTGGVPEALEAVVPGRMIAKTGAEGYLLVFLRAEGLGLAIKVADGNARAREAALPAILGQIGLLDADEAARLAARLSPPILDSRRRPVGAVRPALPPMSS